MISSSTIWLFLNKAMSFLIYIQINLGILYLSFIIKNFLHWGLLLASSSLSFIPEDFLYYACNFEPTYNFKYYIKHNVHHTRCRARFLVMKFQIEFNLLCLFSLLHADAKIRNRLNGTIKKKLDQNQFDKIGLNLLIGYNSDRQNYGHLHLTKIFSSQSYPNSIVLPYNNRKQKQINKCMFHKNDKRNLPNMQFY